jgi:hypothetical protein
MNTDIKFLAVKMKKNATHIYKILQVYAEGIMGRMHVFLWVKRLQDGKEDITNYKMFSHKNRSKHGKNPLKC